jgi:hypothetical protein
VLSIPGEILGQHFEIVDKRADISHPTMPHRAPDPVFLVENPRLPWPQIWRQLAWFHNSPYRIKGAEPPDRSALLINPDPELGPEPPAEDSNRLRLASFPLGNSRRVDSKAGGKLPTRKAPGYSGGFQAGRETWWRRPKRVVSQESDDIRYVLNVRIEVMVLPGIDRRGPDAQVPRQVGLA